MFVVTKSKQSGTTLIELTVVALLVGIVYLGIMGLVSLSSKSMWSLGGSVDVTDQASEAMQIINTDFKFAKASTLGNVAQNSGFEEPATLGVSPTGWEPIVAGNGVNKVMFSSKTGLTDIELSASPTSTVAYYSDTITVASTGKYVISGWLKSGTNSQIGLVRADNSDFAVPVTMASSANYWLHVSSTVSLNTGQQARLKAAIAPGSWSLVINSGALGASCLAITSLSVYKKQIFAGSWEQRRVFSYDESTGVSQLAATIGAGINPHISAMGTYDDGTR